MNTDVQNTEVTSITNHSRRHEVRRDPIKSQGDADEHGAAPTNEHVNKACGAPRSSADDTPERQEDSFPEGGLRAWLVVVGSFAAMFMIFGIVNSTAAFQDYLATHQLQHYSPARVGWIFSVNLFLVFFIGIYAGRAFDAWGPRSLVAVGSIGLVASLMILGSCRGKSVVGSSRKYLG